MGKKKYRVICAASSFLTAFVYLSTTKIGIIFIYTNIFQKIFYFLCFFSSGAVFTYIYTRVNAGGWWRSSGAGCWVQLGQLVADRGGRSSGWPFQFLEGWPAGALVVDRGAVPRGVASWRPSGLGACRVSQVDTVCKCAEPRTCVSVQMCSHLQGMCANVQGFADIC